MKLVGLTAGLAIGLLAATSVSAASITTLVSFNSANGANPFGSLIADASGTLYGTTDRGGTSDGGTVFSLTSSGTLTTLASFNGTNGQDPRGSLIADASGALYGSTRLGGAGTSGTVFRIDGSGFNVGGVAPVPEPATWAMMIIGFGAAGSMIRRRKAVVA